jgi:NAD dependent epimerase/dehydratase
MDMGSPFALVTGAGGFIGSHLVETLLASGTRVRAFVRYTSSGKAGWLEGLKAPSGQLEFFFGDLCDPDAVLTAVRGTSHIFHLGALIAIPYSYQQPRSFVSVNVGGTQNVLEAMRACGTARGVFVSTSEVFGSARYVPMDEEHPRSAQSPYAASKIAADALVQAYRRSYDLPVVIARPFNTYGPRQSLRAIVPTVLAQARSGGPLTLGNLEPRRDLNFVTDTASGLAMCGFAEGIEGQEFNLGSGSEISVGDLARRACELAGRPFEVVTEERRVRPVSSEVDRLLCNSDKARRLLGWEPRVDLNAGLQKTFEWLSRQGEERWVREFQL